MAAPTALRTPAGLGLAGKALWKAVSGAFEFDDPREEHALLMSCQLADDVARLRVELTNSPLVTVGSNRQPVESPLLASIRNAVALQSRLLATLAVDPSAQARSHAGRALASQRWSA
jgi:hypothetical protein